MDAAILEAHVLSVLDEHVHATEKLEDAAIHDGPEEIGVEEARLIIHLSSQMEECSDLRDGKAYVPAAEAALMIVHTFRRAQSVVDTVAEDARRPFIQIAMLEEIDQVSAGSSAEVIGKDRDALHASAYFSSNSKSTCSWGDGAKTPGRALCKVGGDRT